MDGFLIKPLDRESWPTRWRDWPPRGISPREANGMNARSKLPDLAVESYLIPAADAGIELYVRNKRPAGMTTFPPEKILLYVHGATYPSETAFDLPIEGASMNGSDRGAGI